MELLSIGSAVLVSACIIVPVKLFGLYCKKKGWTTEILADKFDDLVHSVVFGIPKEFPKDEGGNTIVDISKC
jgi:hypothetical protein